MISPNQELVNFRAQRQNQISVAQILWPLYSFYLLILVYSAKTKHNLFFGIMQNRRPGFDPWVGKMPWRREWQPTPVFLPGESHGQRSLVGHSPQGCKESDTTEVPQHTAHCTDDTYRLLNLILQSKVSVFAFTIE